MTRLLKLLPISVLFLAPLAGQADEGAWYVSPSIVYFDDDGARKIDDSFGGLQIQVGKALSDQFLLEGLLGYHNIDGFPGQKHTELGINAIRKFRPDSMFSPYLIGGVGYLRADVSLPDFGGLPLAGSTSNSGTATAGLGTQINFGDSPWSLRAEYRLRHAFSDGGLTDQMGSIGIQYSFGGTSAPSAPVTADEPEPVVYADPEPDDVADVREEKFAFSNIYFGFDSDVIHPASRRMLDQAASVMTRHPDLQVEIVGFADLSGSERYNMALSLRRAQVVRDYLQQAGANSANLAVRGFGESNSATHAANRRVELHITNR